MRFDDIMLAISEWYAVCAILTVIFFFIMKLRLIYKHKREGTRILGKWIHFYIGCCVMLPFELITWPIIVYTYYKNGINWDWTKCE